MMTVSIKPPYIKEICQYLADNTGGRFSFGSGTTNNLKLGELVRGVDGVFAVQTATNPPDHYTPIYDYTIDFWAVNRNAQTGYDDLQYIFELFHQNINMTTASFQIYFAYCVSQIEDMDRDSEGRKLWKLTVTFITRNLIS